MLSLNIIPRLSLVVVTVRVSLATSGFSTVQGRFRNGNTAFLTRNFINPQLQFLLEAFTEFLKLIAN